nr:hypothetical protein [Tanacetum cinerariifolium]
MFMNCLVLIWRRQVYLNQEYRQNTMWHKCQRQFSKSENTFKGKVSDPFNFFSYQNVQIDRIRLTRYLTRIFLSQINIVINLDIYIFVASELDGRKRGQVYKFLRSQGFVSSHDTAHHYTDTDAHKDLDFVSLDRSSVSFSNNEKRETAMARWSKAQTRVAEVGKGLL